MIKLLTTDEAAAALRCSAETVRELIAEGRLRAVRVRPRGRLLVDADSLTAAMRQASGRPGIVGVAGSGIAAGHGRISGH